MEKIKNYIAGELTPPLSDSYIENIDPAIGKIYSFTLDSDERDVNVAVDAAKQAFSSWSQTSAKDRSQILLQIAERIEENLEEFARAESIDTGKPIKLARGVDIPRAVLNFRFFATAIIHFFSEAHAMENKAINYTLRNPVGVAGCISPWNLPLYLFTWKIAPALATGNTVVAKPSEITPMTAYLLSKICIEAGLPKGVLNIIHGYGPKVGRGITVHSEVPILSFTGGTKTGREIAVTAAPMFKKVSLELGGKNPVIIFNDCQFDKMLNTTIRSAFSNQGQICLCGSRIYVERSLYSRFKEEFVNKAVSLFVGDPLDDKIDQGAVVSDSHMKKILSYIELAKEEGGHILCGGNQVNPGGRCSDGWFIQPTVIEELSNDCRANQEEIFGPVVTIMPFETEEEALTLANGTDYGLASILWTENLTRAHRLANELKSGIVWINCWMYRDLRTPFGGMKNSGLGREGGFEALKFFTEPKNVCINLE
jgi:aminomuconate-semialdehyde/2-hydroxymuconate-6-semialdehyde dehydrogenase